MKKKVFGFMVAFLAGICVFSNSKVYAAEVEDEIVYATEFVSELVEEDDYYSEWEGAEIEYAYTLYADDLETVAGNLYYVKADGQTEGYLIVNDKLKVAEFSKSKPAYDLADIPLDEYTKYVYSNAMPAIAVDETLYRISMSGEILNLSSDISLFYEPNLQGDNCIVGAISNLLWDWGKDGFDELIDGMTFRQLDATIDSIMTEEGGYANANIPSTIKTYVNQYTSYSATVTNKWNPSFSAVKNETLYRPCLLGFAPAEEGSYDEIEGHMTVCVGTRTLGSEKYCTLMDGHSEELVEKQWGSYNDFMAKVRIEQ